MVKSNRVLCLMIFMCVWFIGAQVNKQRSWRKVENKAHTLSGTIQS